MNYFLALGSNIGDKKQYIAKAIELLEEQGTITALSALYKTKPVGFTDQDWFVNCCVGFETALEPEQVLNHCKDIEKQLGRKQTIRNGPRCIDIDIVLAQDKSIERDNLTIPHKEMHNRAFVLKPLLDIAPNEQHPVLKKTIKELHQNLKDKSGVELL